MRSGQTSGPRPALDVSGLPSYAFGSRDPLWWGIVCLMLIEGTSFVLMYAAHFYIRGNLAVFPPTAMEWDTFAWAVSGQVLLWLSVPPIVLSMKAAREASLRGMKKWLVIAVIPAVLFAVTRALELHTVPFRWDSHAHGSSYWVLQAMQGVLALYGAGEDLILLAVLQWKPVEKKHLVDVHTNGVYWLFTVAAGVVTFALLYLDPAILRSLP